MGTPFLSRYDATPDHFDAKSCQTLGLCATPLVQVAGHGNTRQRRSGPAGSRIFHLGAAGQKERTRQTLFPGKGIHAEFCGVPDGDLCCDPPIELGRDNAFRQPRTAVLFSRRKSSFSSEKPKLFVNALIQLLRGNEAALSPGGLEGEFGTRARRHL